jgi:hypothetical protein
MTTMTYSRILERLPELLAYRAPLLEERLVRERKVTSREEAASLLDEVKKYLVLSRSCRSFAVPMFSRRIDEVWHQFVLFSAEYTRFSERYFGAFVEHAPGNAPRALVDARPALTRDEFRERYEAMFGTQSRLWFDEESLTVDTRLTRKPFDRPVAVRIEGDRAALVAADDAPLTMIRVDAWAAPALAFIIDNEHFYVRELPAPLGDDDRVAICQPLVARSFFRVVP